MQKLSTIELIKQSYKMVAPQGLQIGGAAIVTFLLPFLLALLGGMASSLIERAMGVFVVMILISLVYSAILSVNLMGLYLKAAQGEQVFWREVLAIDWKMVGRFVGTSILMGLIILVGLVLLIVPGIIWSLMYGQAPFVVIDEKKSFKAALTRSKELTRGYRWQLFVVGLFTMIISGIFGQLIGPLVSMIWMGVMQALIYVTLKKAQPTRMARVQVMEPLNQNNNMSEYQLK